MCKNATFFYRIFKKLFLFQDGILTISAPLPPSLRIPNSERLVPIKHN